MKRIALSFILIFLVSTGTHAANVDFTAIVIDSNAPFFSVGSIVTGDFFYNDLAIPTFDPGCPACPNPQFGVPFYIYVAENGHTVAADEAGKFWNGYGSAYIRPEDGFITIAINGNSGQIKYIYEGAQGYSGTFLADIISATPIPEPSTFALFSFGLALIASVRLQWFRRR